MISISLGFQNGGEVEQLMIWDVKETSRLS